MKSARSMWMWMLGILGKMLLVLRTILSSRRYVVRMSWVKCSINPSTTLFQTSLCKLNLRVIILNQTIVTGVIGRSCSYIDQS